MSIGTKELNVERPTPTTNVQCLTPNGDSFWPCNSWAGWTRASETGCFSFRCGAESDSDSVTSCDSF